VAAFGAARELAVVSIEGIVVRFSARIKANDPFSTESRSGDACGNRGTTSAHPERLSVLNGSFA